MTPKLESAFKQEMQLAKRLFESRDYSRCFKHLERAHVLGQSYYLPHVLSHYWMLRVGLRQRNSREIVGQLLRILGSAGSLVGWIPIGNTGGANVSPFKSMTVPSDLKLHFDE
ncbi:hypothetical protein NBRC116583_12860 [Arenicella sp. 4NH20-0111]|uniref:DUF3703 domain-containing protein n=1 Tax=Arenicella sp. 4NH20-0111 TaxID=3127648 RepID=UPI0031070A41